MQPDDWDLISAQGVPTFNRGTFVNIALDDGDIAKLEKIARVHSVPGFSMEKSNALRVALHAYCVEQRGHEILTDLLRAALSWYAERVGVAMREVEPPFLVKA
jgi:hypothetical protein